MHAGTIRPKHNTVDQENIPLNLRRSFDVDRTERCNVRVVRIQARPVVGRVHDDVSFCKAADETRVLHVEANGRPETAAVPRRVYLSNRLFS